MSGDEVLRAYAILSSLQKNVPEGYEIEDSWVHQYHHALEKVEKAMKLDLTDFKVPDQEIHQSIATSNAISGNVTYRRGLWCKRAVLTHKLDSVLTYFSGLQSGQQKSIGFCPPE